MHNHHTWSADFGDHCFVWSFFMLCLWVLKCLAVAAGVKRPRERGSLDLNRHPQTQQLSHGLLMHAGKHYGLNSVPVTLVTSRLAPWNEGNLFPSSFSCSRLPYTLFEPLLFCAPSSQVFCLTFLSSFFSIPSSINNGWHSCRSPHLVTFGAKSSSDTNYLPYTSKVELWFFKNKKNLFYMYMTRVSILGWTLSASQW